jgi:hypothetical protein
MKTLCMAALLLSIPAFASPICRQLDAPGSTYTQGFQLNNAGQIAFGTDVGGFVYSAGAWEQLPTPPGSAQSDFGASGINDLGTIAGVASGAGFLFSGGSYSFFRYPSSDYTNNLPRTVNDNGLVLGEADHFDADGNATGIAYIYNPGPAAGYASGFTLVDPRLPGGFASSTTILGNMNRAGKFVGSGRYPGHGGVHGFIYDPAAGGYSFFKLADGSAARPRGINNQGEIAGGAYTPDFISQGFFLDANGVETRITCPELNAPGGVFVSSLNDAGLMSGDVFDAQGNIHGLVVYPSAAAARRR